MIYRIHKEIGETPLGALERLRLEEQLPAGLPMTYAGRLDPMAEGELIVLTGEDCKRKDQYLKLDKEYEVEVVFGLETDTYDGLGVAERGKRREGGAQDFFSAISDEVAKKVGTFEQEYPAYSSRTVGGVQLHTLARKGELPDEMPTKEVTIYSIDILESTTIPADELKRKLFSMMERVKGDFRQDEIKKNWQQVLADETEQFPVVRLRIKCSSGTYMRSLAHELGTAVGTGAFVFSIIRTQIFMEQKPLYC
jgi:tRNA pseudouridine55 synthase